MTPEEITALAREYAEEATKADASDPNLSATDLNGIKHDVAEYAEEVIRFLLRRFCLVEKEAVRKEYQDATAHVKEAIKSKNPLSESCGKGKRLAIQSLFPEITKEVEG